MGKVRFVTFGCKANQYDTQVLREALVRRGWSEAERDLDLVVINTCTVTAAAGSKARKLARRIARESPNTKIAMVGCLAEIEPEILRDLPGVEWVLGNGEAKVPVNFLRELGHEVGPEELGIPAGISQFQGHTRAFLKIQDGCDMACTFCIIPKVRGKNRSRPLAELVAEVRRLVSAGHVEIVLCGIHIGHWGRELGLGLADLMGALVEIDAKGPTGAPADFRLRLSSIEATEVSSRLLENIASHPERVAPHLHLPLQSGDGEILRRMGRWYGPDEYQRALENIRMELDRPAFTADVIVGFPGEKESHFANTVRMVQVSGFARLHVFPYSARPGTLAGTLADAPAADEVRERRARLSEVAGSVGDSYRRSLEGVIECVVPEGFGGLSGRYNRVRLDPADWPGVLPDLCHVRLELEPLADDPGSVGLLGRPLVREGRPTGPMSANPSTTTPSTTTPSTREPAPLKTVEIST